VAFGAMALALIPAARRPVERQDWPRIAVVAIAGNAGPALLFALAQQSVDSAVAGMANGAVPLTTMAVTVAMTRVGPRRGQALGLAIGFLGIAAMSIPNLVGANASPIGISLLIAAIMGYGLSNNVIVPLQQRYGALPVILRALVIGSVALSPLGLVGLRNSSWSWESVIAVTILGVLGTGAARAMSAALAGRTGASRSAVIGYFVPVFAIILGVTVLDEQVSAPELLGIALILVGGWLTSRRETIAAPTRTR
jgi:drug/metabolite transporter (DMT)-like permease